MMHTTFGSARPVRAGMAGMGGMGQAQPREPCQHGHNLAQVGQMVGTAASSFRQLRAALHRIPVPDCALQAWDASWQAADMLPCYRLLGFYWRTELGSLYEIGPGRNGSTHACL